MGRDSTISATARAYPAGGIFGERDDTISTGPRYLVDHVRVSMVFLPDAIMLAHGCFTDNAFNVWSSACYSAANG